MLADCIDLLKLTVEEEFCFLGHLCFCMGPDADKWPKHKVIGVVTKLAYNKKIKWERNCMSEHLVAKNA